MLGSLIKSIAFPVSYYILRLLHALLKKAEAQCLCYLVCLIQSIIYVHLTTALVFLIKKMGCEGSVNKDQDRRSPDEEFVDKVPQKCLCFEYQLCLKEHPLDTRKLFFFML